MEKKATKRVLECELLSSYNFLKWILRFLEGEMGMVSWALYKQLESVKIASFSVITVNTLLN